MDEAQARLEGLIDRFDPAIAALARGCRAKVRARLPHAFELAYDNYSALAVGYSTRESGGGAIVSIVLYPRWVRFFFLDGARLPDPGGRLEGKGSQVRSIKLPSADVLDDPAIVALIEAAIDQAGPMPKTPGRTIIKSIAARQIPRRPKTGSQKR